MGAEEIIKAYDRDQKAVAEGTRHDILRRMREEREADHDSPYAVQVIHLLLYKPQTGLYVVQRANDKDENPGMWCKTVGGQVLKGENPEHALKRETWEEIGIRLLVCPEEDYLSLLKKADLKKSAVVYRASLLPWFESRRVDRQNKAWKKTMQSFIYLGAFDGDLRLDKDRRVKVKETSAWKIMTIDAVVRACKQKDLYTDDLRKITSFYYRQLTEKLGLPCKKRDVK